MPGTNLTSIASIWSAPARGFSDSSDPTERSLMTDLSAKRQRARLPLGEVSANGGADSLSQPMWFLPAAVATIGWVLAN